MTSLTLSVPEEMLRRMREHTEIRWTEVARIAFAKKLEELGSGGRVIRVRGVPMIGRKLKNKVFRFTDGPRAPFKELGLQ